MLTKHVHDEALKSNLTISDANVEVVPKIIDNSVLVGDAQIVHKPKGKMKVRMVKNKMPVKRTSRLERATRRLYDLEDIREPEKTLNIDFGLYQMEDY